jgi:hypothetical protein
VFPSRRRVFGRWGSVGFSICSRVSWKADAHFSAAAADPAQAVFPYQDMALHDPCAQTGFCPMLQVMQVVTNAREPGLRSGVTLRQGAARQLGCGILCHCFKGEISKFPVVDTMPRPVDHACATRKMRSAYAFDPRQG